MAGVGVLRIRRWRFDSRLLGCYKLFSKCHHVALRLLSIEIMVRQSYYEIEFEFIDRNSTIVVHKSLVSSRLEKKNNRRRISGTTLLLIPVHGYLVE